MKLIRDLQDLGVEAFEPVVEALKSNLHEIFDEAFVYDLREHFEYVSIEWRVGDFRPSVEVDWDGKSAYWHSCNVKDFDDDGEEFYFDPRLVMGWRCVLVRLLYLREVATGVRS